jgi:riboflavin kinase/FMN adenylyltransferase
MQVVRGRSTLAAELGRSLRAPAIAVGNFDGVHRGHQALVGLARDLARRNQGDAVVLTFDPHPARLFAPALAPPLIVSLDRRIELLGEAGADCVVVEPFTPAFAAVGAEDFVRGILAGELGAREVVVGYDFSFGQGRGGSTQVLQALGAELGMGVTVVPPVTVDGLTCSSTKVREFALEGRVEGAALLLGRPLEITGPVARGAGRGRTLGIPTANIEPDAELLPRPGIYAARAWLLEAVPASYPCALSVGTNPTFTAAGKLTVEAHLLDYDGDLYGKRLRLEVLHRLRDERRFDTVDELMAQIREDIEGTRRLFAAK